MADCQLCGSTHPDDQPACPQRRTGQWLGEKYRLGEVIGVGGIAAVYTAEHPILRRTIAVKILHKRFAKDVELASRFCTDVFEDRYFGWDANRFASRRAQS